MNELGRLYDKVRNNIKVPWTLDDNAGTAALHGIHTLTFLGQIVKGERKHTTRWMKIISYPKSWDILHLPV